MFRSLTLPESEPSTGDLTQTSTVCTYWYWYFKETFQTNKICTGEFYFTTGYMLYSVLVEAKPEILKSYIQQLESLALKPIA